MKTFIHENPAIKFGMGVIAGAGEAVRELGGENVMIVTDGFLASCGIADRLKDSLDAAGLRYEMFSDVSPNPTQDEAVRCFGLLRDAGCDIVIGLGGGSPMDVAKCVALLMHNPAPLDQYVGVEKVAKPMMPIIAIPTTSGTGSETSNAAILKNTQTGIKAGIISVRLIPNMAIVDPELTISLPPALTAACGMDALAHAIECFTGHKATPISRMFHREAIALIAGNLREAVGNGGNREARYNMSLGAMYAGIGMAMSGCAAVHALAYPLEGGFSVAHGEANAILLADTMRFNAEAALEDYADIGRLFGCDMEGLDLREQALRSAEAVKSLSEDISIPTLADIGVKQDDIPGLAVQALKVKRLIDNNPRAVMESDAEDIYRAAL